MILKESEQIASIGAVYFWNNCSLIFYSGLTGVYLLAFTVTMYIILQKENTGRAHKAMILLLLMGCGLVVLYVCGAIIACSVLVNFGLVVSLPGGLEAQDISAKSHAAASTVLQDISGNLMFSIADIMIVWRAWAIWAESGLTKFCFVILVLADIGINIADSIVDAQVVEISNISTIWDWIAPVMTLVVNTIATLLIVYQAWTHHKSMQVVSSKRRTQVQAILLLLIESGAVFAVIQVLNITVDALGVNASLNSPDIHASRFLASLYVIGSAINPLAIAILIHTGNTYDHSSTLEDETALSQSIHVARGAGSSAAP